MKFSVFQLSRRGGRAVNEDRMGYCYTREAALFLLADGMGGHADGEVAAQLALQTIAAQFQREARPALPDVQAFLTTAVMAAHRQILRHAHKHHMPDAPRTTLVAAVVQAGQVHWLHCGDSRLYWARQGHLLGRTRDHSYLELGRTGQVPAGMNRNVLYTCLGANARPIYDLEGPHRLVQGDRLLLCSDGLWGALPEDVLLHTLGRQAVADAVPQLVEGALRAAGPRSDNVTALAMEWEMPQGVAPVSGISTDSVPDTGFESTIQPGHAIDEFEAELDEAEIERSIAEINAAIRRSAERRR